MPYFILCGSQPYIPGFKEWWKHLLKQPNIYYSSCPVYCWKCQRSAKDNIKNMPIMGQSFTALGDIHTPVAGVLCPPQWKGSLFSQSVPISFWCQRAHEDMCVMIRLCAIDSSLCLLGCYSEMLCSTRKHTALVSKHYIEGFTWYIFIYSSIP